MPIYDLFSKRRRREKKEAPDVFAYDKIPEALRIQIVHIWDDALGIPGRDHSSYTSISDTYQTIAKVLRREYGKFKLSANTYDPNDSEYAYSEVREFFLATQNIEEALDVIELTFRVIDTFTRRYEYLMRSNPDEIADAAVDELNSRFREHGIGYSYSDRVLIRVDSELTHTEIVRPALLVLRQKGFESAQAEFLSAHQHYRQGKNSEALVDCYKAFESVMKIIAARRGWKVDRAKGAADLVRVCLEKGLIPSYWQSHFAGLRNVLESAIPTPRNKQAGHGAGVEMPKAPPDDLVSYVLHLTAATILFLTEADRRIK